MTEQLCPYCRSSTKKHVVAVDYNRRVSSEKFQVNRCTGCDLRFVTNPPEDLGQYYTSEYHTVPATAADIEPLLPSEQFKLDIVIAHKSHGSLIDIGPSSGVFCQLARRAGFDVSAIEMDSECANFLNQQLHIRAVNSADPAEVLASEGRKYDVISLWHSIEHMPQPWRVLEQAAQHLNPDGILVVAAPNPHAWQAKVLGRRWPHHDLPRHLFALPIPWLTSFGAKASLVPELVTTRDPGSLFWNSFTWAMLLKSLSNSPRWKKRFWKYGLRLGKLLQSWEGREGRGAAYTAVLRSPRADNQMSDTPRNTL
ncbi:class I SAM-dependent methyltransferase [Labrys neptuniae]